MSKIILMGCNGVELSNMPKYDKKECFYGDGAQDYSDYCKYFYNVDSAKEFKESRKYKKVSDSDIEDIKSYFEDFKESIKETNLYSKFDFDFESQVKCGDYFYIVSKDGYDKFGYYDIYYLDMSNYTLYYIHSNS